MALQAASRDGYALLRVGAHDPSHASASSHWNRSAISRAVQRAGNDPDLIAAASTILEPLEP